MPTSISEKKWQKFLSRVWLFRFIPFVDFVFASGSLATGNPNPLHNLRREVSSDGAAQVMCGMNENSDFDVIIGVRQGRIFTARMGCFLVFTPLGLWARHPRKANDRFCFNHFVTPNAYRLSPPYNEYWEKLYASLVPVYGEPEIIQKFYDANADWVGPIRNNPPKWSFGPRLRAGVVSNGMEWFLSGKFGDWLEKILKVLQIKRIESGLKNFNQEPRVIFNDNELEFHPDTGRRIRHF